MFVGVPKVVDLVAFGGVRWHSSTFFSVLRHSSTAEWVSCVLRRSDGSVAAAVVVGYEKVPSQFYSRRTAEEMALLAHNRAL
ncbi:hypothetical protein E5676_scaffold87G00680 [Cucumis melo var. makuwa]|uniref:Uncharacterized protein n=1 Tax=Cucumis melo var. makuwa TaxID=1194695 RepID=A0A5D3CCB8_CUCMM|nr:hypothetical protein E5676_scaffold87G00680 [Cucumis melo var. makuwa]